MYSKMPYHLRSERPKGVTVTFVSARDGGKPQRLILSKADAALMFAADNLAKLRVGSMKVSR